MSREQMQQQIEEKERWIQVLSRVDKGSLTGRIRQLEISVKAFRLMSGNIGK